MPLVAGLTAQALEVQGGFNHQAIPNTLCAFATLGQQPDDALVAGLTARVLEVKGGFNPQNIANTLWVFATLGRQSDNALVEELTVRTLEVQGGFNLQDIANTLRAFATLGWQPQDALVAGLIAQALEVQGGFNPHQIASTLWTICFLSIELPDVVCRLVFALEPRIAALATALQFNVRFQSQVYQFLVSCDVDQGLRAGVSANILALKETLGLVFHAAFVQGRACIIPG